VALPPRLRLSPIADRAALIKIGEYELQIAPFLLDTTLTTPDKIWRAYGGAAKASATSSLTKSAALPPPEPSAVMYSRLITAHLLYRGVQRL
jgi:hypothetical protein